MSCYSKTGYSNSRLSGNFCTTPQPELSFDAMTIVGNLKLSFVTNMSRHVIMYLSYF